MEDVKVSFRKIYEIRVILSRALSGIKLSNNNLTQSINEKTKEYKTIDFVETSCNLSYMPHNM